MNQTFFLGERIYDYRSWNGYPINGLFGGHFDLPQETETKEPRWTSNVTKPRSLPHMWINWRTIRNQLIHGLRKIFIKVENILKGSLNSIPSVKIQIMGRKVCLRCKSKTLLGVVNKF